MKSILLLICSTLVISLSCKDVTTFSLSNPTTDMQHDNHFPRIEIYTEKNYGDTNAGSNTTEGLDGKVRYMGRADHQPYIDRVIYLLDENQKKKLLAAELEFQPYFKEIKPKISFRTYFDSQSAEYRAYFPSDLKGYLSYPIDSREFNDCLLEYQSFPPLRLEVIWLSEDEYYINKIFYRIDIKPLAEGAEKIEQKQLVKSSLQDFMRYSYLVQSKLDEGHESLRLSQSLPEIKATDKVLQLNLTPGMPNTYSYAIDISGDGKLSVIGNQFSSKTDQLPHYKIAGILNILQESTFRVEEVTNNGTKIPQPASKINHDAQVLSMSGWTRNGKMEYGFYNKQGNEVKRFLDQIFQLLSAEIVDVRLR